MSRNATLVINTCVNFEVDWSYHSRVSTTKVSVDRQIQFQVVDKGGQFSNFTFLTLETHFLGGNDV